MTPADDSHLEHYARVRQALENRWPEDRIAPTLDRMRFAVELLGDPHAAYPVVHVAGTNGKTSTARMIDALLMAFGVNTGRFTSPHLETMLERITLRGEPIDVDRFVAVYDDVIPYIEMVDARSIGEGGPAMSTFEVLTTMAFGFFADAPVDAAVIEVGMGGTWDATNVVTGSVNVVTPIGLDHAQYLGIDLASVAGEKAGIIEADRPAVLAVQQPEAAEVLERRIAEVQAVPVREGSDFGVTKRSIAVGGQLLELEGLGGRYDEIFLPLHGGHQARNAALALAAVESFLGGGAQRLDAEVVRDGFAAVASPGRLEVVRRSPTVVLDGAHNVEGARALAKAIPEAFSFDRLVVVVGVASDKDARAMLRELEPIASSIVVTEANSPRALPAEELAEAAREVMGDDRVMEADSLIDALDIAITDAEVDAFDASRAGVLVTGSLMLVGQARSMLKRGGA